ncbi:MAG: carboxypeptidase-like regulatory domain-containing protein [Saprospiraceae bacterium]
MKKLCYFVVLSLVLMACSKNQDAFLPQPSEESNITEAITLLFVNVTLNEQEQNQGCTGTCNTHAPVSRASVAIKSNSSTNGNDAQVSFLTSTGENGFASFKEIPPINYTLTVSCEYGSKTVDVTVGDKKTTIVDIGF